MDNMYIQCAEFIQNIWNSIGAWMCSSTAQWVYKTLGAFLIASILTLLLKKPKFEMARELSFFGKHKFVVKYINKSYLFDLHNIQVNISLRSQDAIYPRPVEITFDNKYTKKLDKKHFNNTGICADMIEFVLQDEYMVLFCKGGYVEISISGETAFGSKRTKVQKYYISSDVKAYDFEDGNSIKLQKDMEENALEYRMRYAERIDNSFYNSYVRNGPLIPMN